MYNEIVVNLLEERYKIVVFCPMSCCARWRISSRQSPEPGTDCTETYTDEIISWSLVDERRERERRTQEENTAAVLYMCGPHFFDVDMNEKCIFRRRCFKTSVPNAHLCDPITPPPPPPKKKKMLYLKLLNHQIIHPEL